MSDLDANAQAVGGAVDKVQRVRDVLTRIASDPQQPESRRAEARADLQRLVSYNPSPRMTHGRDPATLTDEEAGIATAPEPQLGTTAIGPGDMTDEEAARLRALSKSKPHVRTPEHSLAIGGPFTLADLPVMGGANLMHGLLRRGAGYIPKIGAAAVEGTPLVRAAANATLNSAAGAGTGYALDKAGQVMNGEPVTAKPGHATALGAGLGFLFGLKQGGIGAVNDPRHPIGAAKADIRAVGGTGAAATPEQLEVTAPNITNDIRKAQLLSEQGAVANPTAPTVQADLDLPQPRPAASRSWGTKGRTEMGEDIRDTMEPHAEARKMLANAEYDKAASQLLTGKAASSQPIRAAIQKLRSENLVDRGEAGLKAVDPGLDRALSDVDEMLTKVKSTPGTPVETPTTILGPNGRPVTRTTTPGVHGEVSEVTDVEMRRILRGIKDRAEFGGVATPENRPWRVIWSQVGRSLEAMDPRWAEVNAKYAGEMQQLERFNDVLRSTPEAQVTDRASRSRAMQARIEQAGQDSPEALRLQPQLDEIAAQNPEYADMLKKMAAENATLDLAFTPWASGGGFLSSAYRTALQNTKAIAARIKPTPSRAEQNLGAELAVRDRLSQIARQRRKDKDKENER